MNLLFVSYAFYPKIGGIESSAALLLQEFRRRAGLTVKIVTLSELGQATEWNPEEVYRRPSFRTQRQLAHWADLVYHHNPALSFLLPSLLGGPTVISIHTWIQRPDGWVSWRDRLKLSVIGRFPCISVSQAMTSRLPFPTTVIENAYDDRVFKSSVPFENREGAVFVGRLVSDKGAPTAVDSIARLRAKGADLPLNIIGDGPERAPLEEQAALLGVSDLVSFAGRLHPHQIADELNRAKYLLVPSKWEEPFGIVALEGIACGCIPLGTNQGGLVDAIGECGPLFPNGDATTLADWLIRLETESELTRKYLSHVPNHLEAHSPERVANAYLEVFNAALRKH